MILTAQNNADSVYYCLVLILLSSHLLDEKVRINALLSEFELPVSSAKDTEFKCLPTTLHVIDQ
jgi:hypothetical protein